MSEVLVVGSLAYDSIETPSGKAERTLGGSANYFSLAASLFAPVKVVGVVGDDYQKQDIELLKNRNIDTSGLSIVEGKTFHWEGSYEGDLNQAITKKTELNVFEHFNPQLPPHYRNTPFLFLANIAPDLQLKVLNQCSNPLFVGMDTMNFWINSKYEDLLAILKKVDVVLINEHEAMMLTNSPNALAAAKKVVTLGPKRLVIKRGEYGFVLYTQESGYFILPAFPVEHVVDPTGAGDTFAGGFFGYLSSLQRVPSIQDLKEACINGLLLASFTIQDFGITGLSKVTREQLNQRSHLYKKVITL